MAGELTPLFEAMLYRDEHAIREQAKGSGIGFADLVRFAVMTFVPSGHGRAALAAVIAADRFECDEATRLRLATECAVYLANIRAPWSEPPIAERPQIASDHPTGDDEIEAAIRESDRGRAERWLAASLETSDFTRRFFTTALARGGENADALVVSAALWRAAAMAPPAARYAVLRNAVTDWMHHGEAAEARRDVARVPVEAFRTLAALAATGMPDIQLLQRLAAFDAVFDLMDLGLTALASRAAGRLALDDPEERQVAVQNTPPTPVYDLARDYACYLRLTVLAQRLRNQIADGVLEGMLNAAWQHQVSESYAEWTGA